MSNKTNKLIALLVTLLITLTLLSACGEDKDKKSTGDKPKTTTADKIAQSDDSDSSGTEDELGLCDIVTEETIKTAFI